MTAITYTAKRNLIAGHTLSASYSLETAAQQLDPTYSKTGEENTSLDGITEAVLDRVERGMSVQTDIITAAELPQWEEFFDSVAAVESFTFDDFGTIAVPSNPKSAVLVGTPKPSRAFGLNYQFSFTVRFI